MATSHMCLLAFKLASNEIKLRTQLLSCTGSISSAPEAGVSNLSDGAADTGHFHRGRKSCWLAYSTGFHNPQLREGERGREREREDTQASKTDWGTGSVGLGEPCFWRGRYKSHLPSRRPRCLGGALRGALQQCLRTWALG